MKIKYSVVIISYNEEKNILACIASIKQSLLNNIQIIVADGGSSDSTLNLARSEEVEIVKSSPGRGIQCSAGVKHAKGDIILFLHADTILPDNAFEILDKYFETGEVEIGTFRLAFDKKNLLLSFYTKFTTIDSIYTRFGDQCIVIRKDLYKRLNGFKQWPLYEDVDLLRRARKVSKIYSFPASVITSSRRFENKGIIKQQLLNGWHILQYLIGISPHKLARKYNTMRKPEKAKSLKPELPLLKEKAIINS
jgi:rSAM/selenodomain-associated transferase 2